MEGKAWGEDRVLSLWLNLSIKASQTTGMLAIAEGTTKKQTGKHRPVVLPSSVVGGLSWRATASSPFHIECGEGKKLHVT